MSVIVCCFCYKNTEKILLTDIKTSSACCKIATRDHLNLFINLIRVGLCTVAEGCVRNNVGKRLRSDNAGLDAP